LAGRNLKPHKNILLIDSALRKTWFCSHCNWRGWQPICSNLPF